MAKNSPLCFVLMPFGKKQTASEEIDFDAVYENLIKPAVKSAGMEPLRADEEKSGGLIHKPMFERLMLCDYAVADLTTANANVFYELGIRHAIRHLSTVLLYATGEDKLPFDVATLRVLPYKIDDGTNIENIEETKSKLTELLKYAKNSGTTDSPIYQLIKEFPDVGHTKTDLFREIADYSPELRKRLKTARKEGVDSLRKIEQEIPSIEDAETGVVVDLFLSYRAVKAYKEMIALVDKMSKPLSSQLMIQEQLGFALNRDGKADEAEEVLLRVIDTHGLSSETCGILGRVYKDRWEAEKRKGQEIAAESYLLKAIETYLKGFETDWRDAYPGVNAVTLMEYQIPPNPKQKQLMPVVHYAVERRIAAGSPDYWDYATLLELNVLTKDREKSFESLLKSLPIVREPWEPETTANNLRLIRETRESRAEAPLIWDKEIEVELLKKL
ncbi:MAG: DUF4071 domain-containing protein [Nitrospirae bacterium]|nr:DUF4071 domain-containing protein [Nitrospirota bacterium]